MKLARVRLKGDVQGVGVKGLVTKVDPDLAKVLFSQGRAEAYEPPVKAPPPPAAPKAIVIDDPLEPGEPPEGELPKLDRADPPKPDEKPIPVPLSDAELRLKLKSWKVKVPKDAKRDHLLRLYHANKPEG